MRGGAAAPLRGRDRGLRGVQGYRFFVLDRINGINRINVKGKGYEFGLLGE